MVKDPIGVIEFRGLMPTWNFEIFSDVLLPFAKQPSSRHFTHGYIQRRSFTSSNGNENDNNDNDENNIDNGDN